MIFATALTLEREPMRWIDLPPGLVLWVQNAGAVAALGLFLFMLAQMVRRGHPFADVHTAYPGSRGKTLATLATTLVGISLLGYVVLALIGAAALSGGAAATWMPRAGIEGALLTVGDYILIASGLLALVVALTPMLLNVARLRWGRIWALARLSLKEAIRSRVVLIFGAMALVFLFADWFVPYKAEDQVRNYVRVVYWSMTPLFLLTAGLLGAMSIPADIKSQAIHTVATKPVEKFEIVLGRFLGYAVLLTVGLASVSALSLVYIVRGVNEDAARESYKARVPVFGELTFVGTKRVDKGESVGREWDYRSYISGPQHSAPGAPRQYAIWSFDDVPAALGERAEPTKLEFTFDIFRLSKGEVGKGLYCSFTFAQGHLAVPQIEQLQRIIQDDRDRLQREATDALQRAVASAADPAAKAKANEEYAARLAAIPDELLAKHGLYQASGVEVTDYHTQTVEVPAAFFKAVNDARGRAGADGKVGPPLRVFVSVDPAREAQLLGVARRDLYLLSAELPFWQNFLKGVVGMWCTTMLVLGVAVACSTYLSGIISWLCTMFLYTTGMFGDYLQRLSENRVEGGGPSEALFRLATRAQTNTPLDSSPTVSVLKGADEIFSWWMRRFLNLVPDVNRFDLHQYVANGFDVSPMILVADNVIPLVGYLLPWAILAYYLMKYREVANPN